MDTTGAIIDPSYLLFETCDQTVEALTRLELIDFPTPHFRRLIDERPSILRALMTYTLVQASTTQQWLANVGGRPARARTAHLLCEFAIRIGHPGMGEVIEYDLPLTQAQLAEVLGLTLPHVNRTLQDLAAVGLIERKRSRLRILDFAALEIEADFSARYLHLERSPRDRRKRPR